jgi:hypothetical protein
MFSAPPIDFAESQIYVGTQNKFLLKIPQGQQLMPRGDKSFNTRNESRRYYSLGQV